MIIIRWFLSILLLIGIYSETGIFTALAFAVIMIRLEAPTFIQPKDK